MIMLILLSVLDDTENDDNVDIIIVYVIRNLTRFKIKEELLHSSDNT